MGCNHTNMIPPPWSWSDLGGLRRICSNGKWVDYRNESISNLTPKSLDEYGVGVVEQVVYFTAKV